MNKVQAKLDNMVKERDDIIAHMNELSDEYDKCKVKLSEVNGGIKTLVELFANNEEVEESNNDKEDTSESRSDSNKG